MSVPVKLYVYDLSNGMARQLSRQLTGRQIDGIWHTSVVVFGKEVFYGQGISTTTPGRSHHGSPSQILDMGETALDEGTFEEYLLEMREHYTADKYHLLEFNCNSFTNDCIGFLTGGTIPAHIKDLPTDFLSTPFGASLRPTIDAMYRRPSAISPAPTPQPAATTAPDPQLTASILQAVAQLQANGSATRPQVHNPITGSIHIITNTPSFRSFIKSHKAAVAFFTSQTCPPCRMIEPVFERLSEEKGLLADRDGAGFAKIDIGVGAANQLASEYGVRATPTFMFFFNGEKVEELKGADANELRTQIDILLFQAYPPHPHRILSVPAIQAMSFNPILFTQVPAIDTVFTKLLSFIDNASWPSSSPQSQSQVKQTLASTVLPYLKSRFVNSAASATATLPNTVPSATPKVLDTWAQATTTLVAALPVESLFPLVDMWRLSFTDPALGAWISRSPNNDPINAFFPKAIGALQAPSKGSRNYILTFLRLLSNGFASTASAKWLMTSTVRERLTLVLVPSLLHDDAAVRTAAASLAFNTAAGLQKARSDAVKTGRRWDAETEGEDIGDWQVEVISALIEAVDREKENEEVVHRLAASLACLIRLSPFYDTQVKPLLEVLQSRQILKSKLTKGSGWNTEGGLAKKEVRNLVEEIANKLCP